MDQKLKKMKHIKVNLFFVLCNVYCRLTKRTRKKFSILKLSAHHSKVLLRTSTLNRFF